MVLAMAAVGPALQISFSLYPIQCWSQELFLISTLQVKLYLRV